jgi:hypothetical protein
VSGSPIIQDGKLVGAVTHVLVNDRTIEMTDAIWNTESLSFFGCMWYNKTNGKFIEIL